ncbi:MAG: anti-sigma factor [Myxococcales bacterium]
MKRCEEVVPLLGPMLDEALPDDDREWVEEHVKGCGSCRDRQALIAAQGTALRELYASKTADFNGFSDRVMARVAADKGRAPVVVWGSELWRAHRGAFAAAGGLAVAACMALAVLFVPPATKPQPTLLAQASAPTTQVDEVDFGTHDGAVLQLPNQTTMIWMSEDRE